MLRLLAAVTCLSVLHASDEELMMVSSSNRATAHRPPNDRLQADARVGDANLELFTITRKMHPVHNVPWGGYSIGYRSGDPGLQIEGVDLTKCYERSYGHDCKAGCVCSPAVIAGISGQQDGHLIVCINGEDVHDIDYAFPADYPRADLDRDPDTVRGPHVAANKALDRTKEPANILKPFTIGVREVSDQERAMWKQRHDQAATRSKSQQIDAMGFETWAAWQLDEMSVPFDANAEHILGLRGMADQMRAMGRAEDADRLFPTWATTPMHVPMIIKKWLDNIPTGYLAGKSSDRSMAPDEFMRQVYSNQEALGRMFRERGWQGALPFTTSLQYTLDITGPKEQIAEVAGKAAQKMADETGGRVTTRTDRREGQLTMFDTHTYEPTAWSVDGGLQ